MEEGAGRSSEGAVGEIKSAKANPLIGVPGMSWRYSKDLAWHLALTSESAKANPLERLS